MAAVILKLGTRGEWSTSHPGRFTPGKKLCNIHKAAAWAVTAVLHSLREEKNLFGPAGIWISDKVECIGSM